MPKCQMKDKIDFKIDRIPLINIHGRANSGRKATPQIYMQLPWHGGVMYLNEGRGEHNGHHVFQAGREIGQRVRIPNRLLLQASNKHIY
jgi:hypothetical protein